jgi:radical SAM superfamily enzyme YgiQ (UPF0313 family)
MINKLNKKPSVFVADLTYDTNIISNDLFPLGIGYVIAYVKQVLAGELCIEQFKFPNELFDAIDRQPPDVLALSYFPWNLNLTHFAAEYFRAKNPDGLIVYGGNSVPLTEERQRKLLTQHEEIDVLVPYDGELAFHEILKAYLRHDCDKAKMMASGSSIDGSVFYQKGEDVVVAGSLTKRPKDFDTIPSPYLTGLFDRYFDNDYLYPMIQTSRGCPFSCTYCWAGNKEASTMRHFSLERIFAELDYIVERRKDSTNKRFSICDTNFGMYDKDEEIGNRLAEYQEKYNYPSSFGAPYALKRRERTVRIAKRVKSTNVCVSVQSTDQKILKNVERPPIKIEECREIVKQLKASDIPVHTEIIAGLPGETRATHLQTIKDLLDMGIDEIHAFTLMFLEGIGLGEDCSQEENQWHKQYRALPRNFGEYRNKRLIEIETVGVGSSTYSFEDFLYMRGFHGALMVINNSTIFAEFVSFMRGNGVDVYSFALRFYNNVRKDEGEVGKLFRAFLKESEQELWKTKDEVEDHYKDKENFNKLLTGEQGDNLLLKYKTLSICGKFSDLCEFYHMQLKGLLIEKGLYDERLAIQLDDIRHHVMAKADNVFSVDNSLGRPVSVELRYNVPSWKKQKFTKLLNEYKLKKPIRVDYVSRESKRPMIKEVLSLFSHSQDQRAYWRAIGVKYFIPNAFREPQV